MISPKLQMSDFDEGHTGKLRQSSIKYIMNLSSFKLT